MSITRADLQAALDGKIPNLFHDSRESHLTRVVTAIGRDYVLYVDSLNGEHHVGIDAALRLWSLPVVEQPAPAVIPIDDCFRILVNENGELYAIEKRANLHQAWCADNSNGSLAYAVVVAGLHAKNKRLDAECAEKDALIEKYRALAKSARAWLAFGQCSANNCETITTLLAEVENV